MKKITKLLIIIGILFIIAGCNNNNSDNEYVLKFETNTSVKLEDRVYEEYKSKIGELPTVTKEGYTFIGWYVNPNFLEGTEVTSETLIGKNITIYAKFEPNKYRINYDLDGGTVADGGSFDFNDNIKHYDEILTLPRLEKENYLFLGWEDPNNKLYKTEFLKENNFSKIDFIYNNSYIWENKIIVGTRGWSEQEENPEKIIRRENLRLELSIQDGIKKFGDDKEIIVCIVTIKRKKSKIHKK